MILSMVKRARVSLSARAVVAVLMAWVLVVSTAGISSAWADGNTAPIATIVGASTQLNGPNSVAWDSTGNLYVVNFDAQSVTMYASGWTSGDTAPTKTLIGGTTGLSQPSSVAFDSSDNMYVTNFGANSVTVYASGWADGDTAPTKTLIGGSTGLFSPTGITLDDSNNMYVASYNNNSVFVYSSGWASGDTAPARTLAGGSTGLSGPQGIALDSAANVYVTNNNTSVAMYASSWTGDTAPAKTLSGGSTGLANPYGVAVDSDDNLYVTNNSGDSVTMYPVGWASGNTAPTKTLIGAATLLDGPTGIAFGSDGAMYVTNYEGDSVTVYSTSDQTISFTDPPDTPLSGSPVTLTATATSTLPVTFTSATTGVCTVSGNIATLVAAGTCTINANQAGDADWNPAPQVSQSFDVTKDSQTITFTDPPDTPLSGSPVTLTAAATSSLPVTFTSATTGVCTISGTTAILVSVGTCTINADQAGDATWAAAPQVSQSFDVTKNSQTITFTDPPDTPLSGSPVTLTATATSSLPVTFTSATTGVCTISGNTATLVAAGTCTINADQAGDATWAAAPQVSQSFDVTKDSQTISFTDPPDTPLSGSPVTLTATATSSLPVTFTSATTGVCTISGNTATLVAAGTCTINADQAGDADWNPAPQVSQSFEVTGGPSPRKTQRAVNGCVTPGSATSIPLEGSKQLMKPECITNAGNRVGVRVDSATPRGDLWYFQLYCQTGNTITKTQSAGYGRGYRVCRTGSLKIRTSGIPLKLRITWYAPATSGYKSYTTTKKYRTRATKTHATRSRQQPTP